MLKQRFRKIFLSITAEDIHLKLRRVEGTLRKTKSKVPVKNLVGPIQRGYKLNSNGKLVSKVPPG